MTAGSAWDDRALHDQITDLHGHVLAGCGPVSGAGFTVDDDPAGVWVDERLGVPVDREGRPVGEAEAA